MTDSRTFLRHTIATIAYRGGKTIRDAPASFANYGAPETARTPAKILAHISDLMDWALSMADGSRKWNDSIPLPWDKEGERFFAALKKFDDYLGCRLTVPGIGRKALPGPDCRCADSRRPTRNAPTDGRRPDQGRELLRGGNYRGPCRRRSSRAAKTFRLGFTHRSGNLWSCSAGSCDRYWTNSQSLPSGS